MGNEVYPIKSKKDFAKLKTALHGRDRLILTLGTAFGLRISDLLTLKVGQLRNQDTLVITEAKCKKKRTITLSPSVKKELSILTGDDDDYVFRSRKGNNAISRVQAYRILNAAVDRAGIRERVGAFGCHSTRKTFGFRLYENGVNITRIMTILAHSSERETLKYIGVTADEISEAYESIEI